MTRWTSSGVHPGMISRRTAPPGLQVDDRDVADDPLDASGRGEVEAHPLDELGVAVLVLVGHEHDTRLAQNARSWAPPMLPVIRPGTWKLARSPLPPTSSAPSRLTSIQPPRISSKDCSCDMNDMPGVRITGCPPPLIRFGSADVGVVDDDGPEADDTVLGVEQHLALGLDVHAHEHRDPEPEVHDHARLELLGGAHRDRELVEARLVGKFVQHGVSQESTAGLGRATTRCT